MHGTGPDENGLWPPIPAPADVPDGTSWMGTQWRTDTGPYAGQWHTGAYGVGESSVLVSLDEHRDAGSQAQAWRCTVKDRMVHMEILEEVG